MIRFAAASAVCHFHGGAASKERVMQRLGIPAGTHTKKATYLKDKKRVRKSDKQVLEKEKKKRQAQDMQRTRREAALKNAEGDTYLSRAF